MKKYIYVSFFAVVGVLSFAFSGGTAHADWSTLNSSTTKEFTGISCPDPRVCYFVTGIYLSGGSGSISKTVDGGETFTMLNSPTSNPLHAISCPSLEMCYSAGDFGTFLKTSNGGASWTESTLGGKANSPKFTNLLALDEQTVLVIGKDAAFYRSEDGGVTWGRPQVRSVSDLYAIYFLDGRNGFIAGDDGALFVTEDRGATWEYRNTLRTAGQIRSISGDGKQTLYAVGDTVNVSTDGGKTWKRQTAPTKSHVAVFATDASSAYLLGDLTTIVKTTDGGATWAVDKTVPNSLLQSVICPGSTYCLIAGGSGKVLRLGTPPEKPLPPPPPPAPVVPVPPPVVVPAPTPIPVVTTPPESKPVAVAPVKSSASASVLTRTLKKGASGKDVKKLQELLAGVAGVYEGGEATGYFGPSTAKAVAKFQEKYELVKPGAPGYGEAGPKTRAKLLEVAESGAEATPAPETTVVSKTTPAVFVRTLKKGASGADVKRMQEILSADKEVYPEGDLSGYFGPATKRAVGKFQEKYHLASPGDPGYGEAGPKTRAKLSEFAE